MSDEAADCQTPGAVFSIDVGSSAVSVLVVFGRVLDMTETQAAALEDRIHDALEAVLAQHFTDEQAAAEAAGPEPDFPAPSVADEPTRFGPGPGDPGTSRPTHMGRGY